MLLNGGDQDAIPISARWVCLVLGNAFVVKVVEAADVAVELAAFG